MSGDPLAGDTAGGGRQQAGLGGRLPPSVVGLLRRCRSGALRLLGPLDYLARAVNGRRDFPPLHLRRYVGPLRSFEMSGAEFMSYCRLLLKLRPEETFLDVGCGCGLMALQLKDYLVGRGSYTGVDVHGPSIEWCRKTIGGHHKNFDFQRIDVKSDAYNPRGRHTAEAFTFPFEDGAFDCILLKSVFTHMLPPGVDNYLKEVSRLLSDDGRCLMTFFLLNEEQEELARHGQNKLAFNSGGDIWRAVYPNSPESAVAYSERYVLELLAKYNLTLRQPVMYGTWSGRVDGLSFQDMLLVGKRDTNA